jgi:hypothetical protein
MSRSKFKETGTVEGAGLWRVPAQIGKLYLAPGENETVLNDPKRGAEIAAAYMKDLLNVFGMDNFMYAIASYGLPLDQAGQIREKMEENATAPALQANFWRMIKLGIVPRDCADRVINFYAAGIVGENPQTFGLQTERLSSLY